MFTNLSRFLLRKKIDFSLKRKRNEHFQLDHVKSVGILFTADSAGDVEVVRKYMKTLNNRGNEVSVLCFYKSKEVSPLNNPSFKIDFFVPKGVNMLGVPKPPFINSFIAKKFDLLIDLDINGNFPIEYISTLSKASFKVGMRSDYNESVFDIMIELNKTKNINYLIEQIEVYLKMIKNQHK